MNRPELYELSADGGRALDVFYHPYAYAAPARFKATESLPRTMAA